MSGNVVTIGTFDGVHLGHRAILDRVDAEAKRFSARRVAYVFESPPRMTLEPRRPSRLLLPLDVRLKLLHRFVDRVVLARFSEVRALSPDAFAADVIARELKARSVVVGAGFRFGRDRSGDVGALIAAGETHRFDVRAVEPLRVDGEAVSSTRIRSLLSAGDVARASVLLGRPPLLFGRAVRGERVEGRFGYPTADLDVAADVLLPADGSYAVRAFVDGESLDGLLYIGTRPTHAGNDRRCEVHLLSSDPIDLYDHALEVHIHGRLRGDRSFRSLGALREQIAHDVAEAVSLLTHLPASEGPVAG